MHMAVPGTLRKDSSTVRSDGTRLALQIDGVVVRPATTHADARGTLCEIFNPAWGFTEEPLVYVYQAAVRPGQTKGWVVHAKQDDRLFFSRGTAKIVLYDSREESSTFGMINELHHGDHSRALVRIPCGVFHAVQNVGTDDVEFINLPTVAYRHDDPDKYRLPLDTEAIPYRF